eukprot:965747-Pyramimonas_sp.AAC.1
MSHAVCLFRWPTSSAFKANCEDVSGGALVSAPLKRAPRGYCMGPFAASLWECFQRFACFGGPRRLRVELIVRMSQAGRWFQHP